MEEVTLRVLKDQGSLHTGCEGWGPGGRSSAGMAWTWRRRGWGWAGEAGMPWCSKVGKELSLCCDWCGATGGF